MAKASGVYDDFKIVEMKLCCRRRCHAKCVSVWCLALPFVLSLSRPIDVQLQVFSLTCALRVYINRKEREM